MIKKLTLLLTFLLVTFGVNLLLPTRADAQGTFGCQYSEFSKICVSRKDDNCERGFFSVDAACSNLDKESCNSGVFTCSNKTYKCSDLQCIACNPGENCQYTNEESCRVNCRKPPESQPIEPGSVSGPCGEGYIYTALGCIPISSPEDLVGFILRFAVGIGGGIAFLLVVYAGFIIMTSTGNPERLKGGQELLTSAVAGLIMLIFSIFLLRLIGVNILQIPGFGQ